MTNEPKHLKMQLQCPMPKFDFDMITLGHGSGGVLTHRLLENGVFNILHNDILAEKHDGAILNLTGKTAFTADSFVVSPIFFPGGNIGDLAVNGSVNDICMCGAEPKYLSLSFIIEEGFLIEDLWKILCSIREAADFANVKIVTGDTKVVEKGKGDGIFINTNGIGTVYENANIHIRNILPTDKIIINAPLAQHGVAIMSVRKGLAFETDIVTDSKSLHIITKKMIEKFGQSIHFLRDPTRGGVATVLNEMAKETNLGITINEAQLPIEEAVAGACEMLGLDPLYVANEGVFIAIVATEKATEIVDFLQQETNEKNASIIGSFTTEHPKQVFLKSGIGGTRVVSMLPGEQLPRIC